jgi:hypothetical protein
LAAQELFLGEKDIAFADDAGAGPAHSDLLAYRSLPKCCFPHPSTLYGKHYLCPLWVIRDRAIEHYFRSMSAVAPIAIKFRVVEK